MSNKDAKTNPGDLLKNALAKAKASKPATGKPSVTKPKPKPAAIAKLQRKTADKPAAVNASATATATETPPASPASLTQDYTYAEQADACDSETVAEFYRQMHAIANAFDDPELPYMLKQIREYLNDNPECQAIIQPDDIGLLVKALRASYKQAANKKAAGVKKRSAASAKVNEIADALDGLFG